MESFCHTVYVLCMSHYTSYYMYIIIYYKTNDLLFVLLSVR